MFRIRQDPSSGSILQYFAKITRMVDTDVVGIMAAYVAITPTLSMSTDTIEPFL